MRKLTVVIALLVLCAGCNSDVVDVLPDLPGSNILFTADPVVDTTCAEEVQLVGTLLGGTGLPVGGAPVTFEIVPGSANPASLTGVFDPVSTSTNAFGVYAVGFTLDQQVCQSDCTVPGTVCTLSLRATADGVQSNEIPITETL